MRKISFEIETNASDEELKTELSFAFSTMSIEYSIGEVEIEVLKDEKDNINNS